MIVWDSAYAEERASACIHPGKRIKGKHINILEVHWADGTLYYLCSKISKKRADFLTDTETALRVYSDENRKGHLLFVNSLKSAYEWLNDMEKEPERFV